MKKNILLALITLSLMHTKVHALTLSGSTVGPPACSCEIAHTMVAVISTDKSTYAPGETMTINTTIDLGRDIGARPADSASASASYRAGPTFDYNDGTVVGVWQAYLTIPSVIPNIATGYSQSGSVSLTIPSSMTSGSHYIQMKAALTTTWNPSAPAQSGWRMGNLSFNVAAVAPPSVNLWFSSLTHSTLANYIKKNPGNL